MPISSKTLGKHAHFPQFVACISASLSAFATGIAYGWSSPVGSWLTSSDTTATPVGQTFSAESEEIAWITSILIIGILMTSLVTSYLADKIGRQRTLLFGAIFFIVAHIMFIFAYDISVIYVGRIIQGMGAASVITTLPLYIGEIATTDVRGAMGSIMGMFLAVGTLYVYTVGVYTSYSTMQIACLAIPVVFIATFFFMPESPYYLIAKGRQEKAINSLKFLRQQSTEDLEEEINSVKKMIEVAEKTKGSFKDIFTIKGNLKAFLMCLGLIVFQQFSGTQPVLFNVLIILEKAHTAIDPGLASILVGVFKVAATGVTPLLVDRLGRKTLLLISEGFMSLGLLLLGLFLFLDQTEMDTSSIFWLPLVSLIVFVVFNAFGMFSVPFAIIGEIFPPEIKFNASAFLAMSGAIIGFAVTRFYPAMSAIGSYFPFWFYSIFCALGFVYVFFVLIETKGLSLQQIQDLLGETRSKNVK